MQDWVFRLGLTDSLDKKTQEKQKQTRFILIDHKNFFSGFVEHVESREIAWYEK